MQTLFLNTILLGGSTLNKIKAAQAAGFDQLELWRQDIEASGQSAAQMKQTLQAQRIGLTDCQVLMDFDGAPESERADKRADAIALLDTAVQVGAPMIIVPASTSFACEPARIVDDMRWLAREAAQRDLRIGYEGMAWSTVLPNLPAIWKVVQEVDAPNLGVVVDAFHIFARERSAADLDGIPLERIFIVQLSDLAEAVNPGNIVEVARSKRLLPGQGRFPLHTLLERLKGYQGPIGLEVFNEEMKQQDPTAAARAAMQALKAVVG